MVVIRPSTMPNLSCSTLATGTRQFVVQEALLTTVCFDGSYLLWFTPMTSVGTSSSLALVGAEMTTRLAPALMWLLAPSRSVKSPVDSTTYEAPSWPHGSSAGLRTETHLTNLPLTTMPSSLAS